MKSRQISAIVARRGDIYAASSAVDRELDVHYENASSYSLTAVGRLKGQLGISRSIYITRIQVLY